jgi:hypothetical protein
VQRQPEILQFFPRSAVKRRLAVGNRTNIGGRLSRIRTRISNEELLREVHGKVISHGDNAWRLDVYGITDDGPNRWVQMGLEGADERTVLLKTAYLADAADILMTVERWLRSRSFSHSAVLTVTGAD